MSRDLLTPLYIIGSVIVLMCCFSVIRCGTRRLGIDFFGPDPEYDYTPVMIEEIRVVREHLRP